MSDQLYVATDARGVQHGPVDVAWPLPTTSGPGAEVESGSSSPLRLYTAGALLEELDEHIFLATASTTVAEPPAHGTVLAKSARLTGETAWDVASAARFALDCAEHVLGNAASAVLPGGATLAEVVADARTVLDRSEENAEQRLGVLARLVAARRLRHRTDLLGDIALATLVEDEAEAVEMLDDPAWATVATVRDAVLGAVEAVRYLAMPRYVASREASFGESRDTDAPASDANVLTTPWGPISFGAEHHRAFEPAWVAARDAAQRALDSARDAGGPGAADSERAWQADRLTDLLKAATV